MVVLPVLTKTALPTTLPLDLARIAQDLQLRKVQVESVVHLLDEGNTVPFITRYRKERTGGLDEDAIRRIHSRVAHFRHLSDRKLTILRSIDAQGRLTDELRSAILAAESPKRLEDLYLPYKPKKRSLATEAREKGLEPLATAIWTKDPIADNLGELLASMMNPDKGLNTADDILTGVRNILSEMVSEHADLRMSARRVIWDTGRLVSAKAENLPEGRGNEYKVYFQFTEPLNHIPPHRILAINRGEKEQVLKVRIEWDAPRMDAAIRTALPFDSHPHRELLEQVRDDSLTRLLLPSLEREVRRELTDYAQEHAVRVFAKNLRSLLLQPPLRGKRVLAVDPGLRTGCKLCALDENGAPIEHAVVYPHAPQNKRAEAKGTIERLVRKHQLTVIAIGNGTACRETEQLVADLIGDLATRGSQPIPDLPLPSVPVAASPPEPVATESPPPETGEIVPAPESGAATTDLPATSPEPTSDATAVAPDASSSPPPENAGATPEPAPPHPPELPLPPAPHDLAYVIVNEAGASDYSTSPVGREEFPDYDATLRGTVSIGRRLQDPLSELVKIDPQHIGVGQYQHDIKPKQLKESLEAVVESCVNYVGVDLNTASVSLLRFVAGLNQLAAREVVDYRNQNGAFRNRDQLRLVPQIGDARFEQAAGFLKLHDGEEPLDSTWIHPESYATARQILADLGYLPKDLHDAAKLDSLKDKLKAQNPAEIAARLQVGEPTIRDIIEALSRPGRDPREDTPPPVFKKSVLRIEDLQPNMELKGTVLNVVDFGAFVDIGIKDGGLVHISQMANRYVKSPHEVVSVGDVITVWVLSANPAEHKVSLTMIPPGTERTKPERRPPRQERPPQRGPRVDRADQPVPQSPPQDQPRTGDRGPRRGGGRPPQRGGRPPYRGHPRPTEAPPGEAARGAEAPRGHEKTPPPRPQPRRDKPPRPLPKLSTDALKGKTPLHSFGELAAFFNAKKPDDTPPEATLPSPNIEPPSAPPPETPPA
jgi:uncharacterized protein